MFRYHHRWGEKTYYNSPKIPSGVIFHIKEYPNRKVKRIINKATEERLYGQKVV